MAGVPLTLGFIGKDAAYEALLHGGGGSVWLTPSYDPALNLIYYGTGNPGTWNPAQRPGDNRWSMTLMARGPRRSTNMPSI